MQNWDWCQFWMYLTTIMLIIATAFVIVECVKEVQETNQRFIEKGYEQVQTVGSSGWRWQQKPANR